MPRRPQNKKELIAAIEREWELLISSAEGLTDEQMNRPQAGGWSPKDDLAHLAEWMTILLGYHIDKRPAHKVIGVPEEITRDWNIEIINQALYQRNKDRGKREVMTQVKRTYRKLITRLKAMSFKELMQPRRADDPRKRPLLLWVLGDTTEHFREHRRAIKKAAG